MSGCTAPKRGHIRGGGADCPVHGRGGGYSRPSNPRYSPQPTPVARGGGSTDSSSSGRSRSRPARPSWSPKNSTVSYTADQVRQLEPVRTAILDRTQPTDVFLCHAWPDRRTEAQVVYELLLGNEVSVWFSEVSLMPGTDMRLAIDKGLAKSRMGLVLVTPAMLEKLNTDRSIANSELSALLRRNLLVPVMHGVTFEELDQVSPMLATRGGFNTAEDSMEDIAVKIAELVGILDADEAYQAQ
ncbi:hypothetical protein CH278_13160 [Rhodococcus sp. 05-2254-5]|uniref:toll/interleukin-1 receptor domain-containing protein n=1 Tax=unclassified Rhodococcus (in: high G+C Gram-positive bacteria) TaxID=192944 RepID=UPI000B9C3217|nr:MULTISPECIES: toll/interleukin-1 receptor domain-containing protein [unclassified Rhodococcus (in: high G+C Gram-positive bacteria)]OZE33561.1 hypothetical protein CH278_13160 [Rhodococcus sp. 05-2254-5]OZE51080.1 hypothetical protein CH269_26105 [Rhodococcus sp. 05-2254-1]